MSKANILSVNLYYQKPVGQTALGMCLKDLSSLSVFLSISGTGSWDSCPQMCVFWHPKGFTAYDKPGVGNLPFFNMKCIFFLFTVYYKSVHSRFILVIKPKN